MYKCDLCIRFNEFIRELDSIYGRHINDLQDSISLDIIYKRVLDKIFTTSGNIFGQYHPITQLFKFLVLLHTHSNNYNENELESIENDKIIRNLKEKVRFYRGKYEDTVRELGQFEKQIALMKKLDDIIYGRFDNLKEC